MNTFAMTIIACLHCLLLNTMPSSSFRLTDLRSHTHSKFSLKDASNTDPLAKYGTQTQVYGVATYDGLFKFILGDPEVRPSFFHALIGINVTSSERLDENMNPLQEFQLLRKFVNSSKTLKTVADLKSSSGFEVRIKRNNQTSTRYTPFKGGTQLLADFLDYFGDIVKAFPTESYQGKMDFVCRLDTGEYALVETQLIKQDFWDMRALAYIAAFYGNQIRKGGEWKNIKKAIGINILGGGVDVKNPWKDAPDEYLRHYRFQEQFNKGRRFIEGLELYQYSLANLQQLTLTDEQRDWLTFFRYSYKQTEADVEKIKTPSVRRAFERAKLSRLTQAQLEVYESEDIQFRRIAGLIKEERAEGKAEGKAEAMRKFAVQLLKENFSLDSIARITGLSTEEVQSLKK